MSIKWAGEPPSCRSQIDTVIVFAWPGWSCTPRVHGEQAQFLEPLLCLEMIHKIRVRTCTHHQGMSEFESKIKHMHDELDGGSFI